MATQREIVTSKIAFKSQVNSFVKSIREHAENPTSERTYFINL